jgi:ABC-type uncharacterized transport system auxiliary subunit
VAVALLVGPAAACGARGPETRYYQLAAATATMRGHGAGGPVLAVEPLDAGAAYDDERIIYRTSPYRLDYYEYHRWSASPGTMVGDAIADVLAASGRFGAIEREETREADVVLGGRLVALEEVDVSSTRWVGRIALDLRLTDARSGDVIWSQRLEATEPLARRSPEGLAAAVSRALARLLGRATPQLAALSRNAAAAHAAARPGVDRAAAYGETGAASARSAK